MKVIITKFTFLLGLLAFFTHCSKKIDVVEDPRFEVSADRVTKLVASAQRIGDPSLGRDYLLAGDYVDSGIPRSLYTNFLGNGVVDELQRGGVNEGIHHEYNAFTTEEGVELVAPNCLQCHSSYINGAFVLGLGNTNADFTADPSAFSGILDALVINNFGASSKEYAAYFPFARAVKATGPNILTETVGSNSADKLAAVLAAHRNREDLTWVEDLMIDLPEEVIPTDVPAWWLLKKKNAMFYTGVGRGDYARISMAASTLTLKDTVKAREIDNKFADVIAYIKALEPPAYPFPVDMQLAEDGEALFIKNCSTCHGTYGDDWTYPNYLVDLDLIQTDSNLISSNFGLGQFVDWYNASWFGQEPYAAKLQPARGYVAPPLDGIWATAPYLHNGSVPTIEALLSSTTRPDIWRKTDIYDQEKLGFTYEVLTEKEDKFTYDTRIKGYGNGGHTFGDKLSELDRVKIIAFLKTI